MQKTRLTDEISEDCDRQASSRVQGRQESGTRCWKTSQKWETSSCTSNHNRILDAVGEKMQNTTSAILIDNKETLQINIYSITIIIIIINIMITTIIINFFLFTKAQPPIAPSIRTTLTPSTSSTFHKYLIIVYH